MNGTERDQMKRLSESAERLALWMERSKIADYVALMEKPGRLMFLNLLAGVSRGLGIAIGFTLLAGILLVVLQRLVALNLPVIGSFIAEIVRIVQIQLEGGSI